MVPSQKTVPALPNHIFFGSGNQMPMTMKNMGTSKKMSEQNQKKRPWVPRDQMSKRNAKMAPIPTSGTEPIFPPTVA